MDSPKRHASNCKHARPTLDQSGPVWLDAEKRPWTCERLSPPRPLETTEICEDCPHWQDRAADKA